jgi:hypothetical protein
MILVVGLSTQRLGLAHTSVTWKVVVDREATEEFSFRELKSSPISTIPTVLHANIAFI